MILKTKEKGQAVVLLLFFMVISISIITSVVVMVANSAASGSNLEQGTVAYYSAETGVENALLRLLRNPDYLGETLNVDGAEVIISVDGGVITSEAHFANSVRKIQAETLYTNNVLNIITWREIK